eukprot:TRINITY_DN13069_c0_g1_i1.p1 TRINITY_DN13069_c0_g1~~TRINITY_DN13069_c0_g1_i1.p1  ORF type:complete len:319 (-),score=136.20 TRINITY_DN13069_c0_g1_i1:262-1218(-)
MYDYSLFADPTAESFEESSQTLSTVLVQTAKRIVLSTAVLAIAERTRSTLVSTLPILSFDTKKTLVLPQDSTIETTKNNTENDTAEKTLSPLPEDQKQPSSSPKLPLKSCLRSPKNSPPPLRQTHQHEDSIHHQQKLLLSSSPSTDHITTLSSPVIESEDLSVSPSSPAFVSDTSSSGSDSCDFLYVEQTRLIAMSFDNQIEEACLELWNPLFSDQPMEAQTTGPRRTHRRRVSWTDIDKGEPLAQKFFYAGSWDRSPFRLQRKSNPGQNALYFKLIITVILIYVLLAFCFLVKYLRSSSFLLECLQSPLIPSFLSRD